jgi:hypothetical protein
LESGRVCLVIAKSGSAADGGAAAVVGGGVTHSSVGAGDDGRDGDGGEGDAVVEGGATDITNNLESIGGKMFFAKSKKVTL